MRSRAAKRANPSSNELDKSLEALEAPTRDGKRKHDILGAQNAGISKKKKAKPMSRQQRLRQQKGFEKADRNHDRLEKKVEISAVKKKRTKERSVGRTMLIEGTLIPL